MFSRMYTKTININKKSSELNINAEFFRQITGKNFLSSFPTFPFNTERYFLNNFDYICVSLGGSFYEKCYPVEKFVKILENLKSNINICLLGIKDEAFLGKKYVNIFTGKNKIINLIGKTSILDLISIIKYSKFLIGNDSGLIHMAVATKTPSICILSGNGYGFCNPYKIENNLTTNDKYIFPICIYKKMECFNCGTQKSCKYKLSKNKKFKCIEDIEISTCMEKIKKSHLSNFFNIK